MAIITTGKTFGTTDAVTSVDLNNVANAATFNDPVDETSLELITSGTNIGKLQIKDAGVTKAKIENVANLRVLGNTSGSAVAPQEVEILDDDTMATATATTLATSESIKAYADGGDIGVGQTWQNVTRALDETSYTNSTGKPIMVKGRFNGNEDDHTVKILVTPSGGSEVEIVFAIGTNSGGNVASDGCIIIPNNTSYKFSTTGNTITFFQFTELR